MRLILITIVLLLLASCSGGSSSSGCNPNGEGKVRVEFNGYVRGISGSCLECH